jgi:hypothetical protein
VPPTNVPSLDASAPTINLMLEWIYGYTAQVRRPRHEIR